MTSFTQKKTTKVRKHWTQKAHESVIRRDGNEQFHLEIEGGASLGLFPLITSADQNRVILYVVFGPWISLKLILTILVC